MLFFMKARDTLLHMWQKEFQTTCRVFKAFPTDQLDVKPHERSRTVRDLAWQCVSDERVIGKVVEGKNDLHNVPKGPPLPETMAEILVEYERVHRDSYAKVSRLTEEEFDRTITFITSAGSGQLEQPEVLLGEPDGTRCTSAAS
jgi:uncharacterized damage-inducible protein DinB